MSPARRTVHPGTAQGRFVTQLSISVPSELPARQGLPEEEKDHHAYGQREEVTDRLNHIDPPLGDASICGIPRAKVSWAERNRSDQLTSGFDYRPVRPKPHVPLDRNSCRSTLHGK